MCLRHLFCRDMTTNFEGRMTGRRKKKHEFDSPPPRHPKWYACCSESFILSFALASQHSGLKPALSTQAASCLNYRNLIYKTLFKVVAIMAQLRI
jgi:hypothetical protein